jgi:AAA+ superfamily predicted ATPase
MSDDYESFHAVAGSQAEDSCEVAPCVEDDPTISEYDMTKNTGRMWSAQGENYAACERAVDNLPPGQYIVQWNQNIGYYFTKKQVNLDSLIELPDGSTERVLEGIAEFWKREQYFRDFGFLWKRGVLLYGPPGSGKTSCVQRLSQQIVNLGGISIYCSRPDYDAEGLRILRTIEPSRPIVMIMEDIDSIVTTWGESDILAMLDGELQVDNIVFVATTNYPEKLDKRITSRPSRFDEVIHVGMPDELCRRVFLTAKHSKLVEDPDKLDLWVESTEGFSVAHMKELIVSVECLGKDFDETVKRLKSMINTKPASTDSERKIGIGNS